MSNIAPMTEEVNGHPSSVFRVSIRAWLALMLCGTVCYMALRNVEVKEPLYSLSVAAVCFYFGTKSVTGKPQNGGS